jgi:hypothetical protein
MAGSTKDIGTLIDYLIHNGVRYNEKPYGLRPVKFGIISDKFFNTNHG